MNVVDSSGWIEFFLAGANGPKFKPVIDQRADLLVPLIEQARALRSPWQLPARGRVGHWCAG